MAALVSAQKSIPLRHTLPSEALNYYTLGGMSIAVWFASARMAARRWSWLRQTAAHLALGAALMLIWQAVYLSFLRSVMGEAAWAAQARWTWMFQLMNACVMYAGVVVATIAIQTSRRARTHERVEHELAMLARDAEMRALTSQLEPH